HLEAKKKYPLKKEILVQMLKLKLESEEESTMALELIRFIKKAKVLAQCAELSMFTVFNILHNSPQLTVVPLSFFDL
ncbi:hypothetical protein Tco_0346499, partial [Tanacetum coccineum]